MGKLFKWLIGWNYRDRAIPDDQPKTTWQIWVEGHNASTASKR